MDTWIARDLVERYLSQEAARAAGHVRKSLDSFADSTAPNGELSGETLRIWRQGLLDSGLSGRTVGRYGTDVNAMLRWAGLEELCFRQGQRSALGGKRFGRQIALEPTAMRGKEDRSVYWRCRCDCGREVAIPAAKLKNGSVLSCGCYKTERLMEANGYVDGTNLRSVLSDTVRKDNTSGCPGVFRKGKKWSARIQYKGKIYSLGTYEELEDAVRARKQAENWVKKDAQQLLLFTERLERQAI